jgi:hypothetical protein
MLRPLQRAAPHEPQEMQSAGANKGQSYLCLGRIGQAINLDGFDDNAAIDTFSYSTGGHAEISVCAWIRTTIEDNQIIASSDRNEYWRLEINGNGGGPGQVGWDVITNTGQVNYPDLTYSQSKRL